MDRIFYFSPQKDTSAILLAILAVHSPDVSYFLMVPMNIFHYIDFFCSSALIPDFMSTDQGYEEEKLMCWKVFIPLKAVGLK